jgi:hypothetical protein
MPLLVTARESGMIVTQMEKHNRSVMVGVWNALYDTTP